MKSLRLAIGLVGAIIFLFFIAGCQNSVAPEKEFAIIAVSIQDQDSLIVGSGIIIEFSLAVDTVSFEAESIVREERLLMDCQPGEPCPDPVAIALDVYRVESSSSVLLNGTPVTLWYEPESHTIALIEEHTVVEPDGTGNGSRRTGNHIPRRLR